VSKLETMAKAGPASPAGAQSGTMAWYYRL
jgi:hypothetical protein